MRKALERYPEVVAASTVTGEADAVVHLRAHSVRHLDEVVERINAEPFVRRTRSTIVLTVTPDHMRGRLGGIEFAQVASTPSLGNLEAGVVAQLTSLRFSIVSGGIGCIVGTLAVAALFPVLLRYDARERASA